MKHYLLFAFIFVSLPCFATSSKVATGDNWPPYSDKSLPGYGISTQIVQAVFDQMGEPLELEWAPWKRTFVDTTRNLYLGAFPFAKNPEREKKVFFSDPIVVDKTLYFTRADETLDFGNVSSHKKTMICRPIGYYVDFLKDDIGAGRIVLERAEDLKGCFKMLQRRPEVKAVVVLDLVGWAYIKKEAWLDPKKFKSFNNNVLAESKFYFVVGKTRPKAQSFLEKFNRALGQIKSNQQYSKIVSGI